MAAKETVVKRENGAMKEANRHEGHFEQQSMKQVNKNNHSL